MTTQDGTLIFNIISLTCFCLAEDSFSWDVAASGTGRPELGRIRARGHHDALFDAAPVTPVALGLLA